MGAIQYTLKEPVGVAGLISPWNLPLYLLTFKIAPALATGNTVVAKPSELTSVTAFHLCEIIKEAGKQKVDVIRVNKKLTLYPFSDIRAFSICIQSNIDYCC